jgi:Ca2+-binding EF-hand superfamily protein
MSTDPVSKLKPDQVKEITTAFNEFDVNGNGSITSHEMKECLRKSNVPYKDAEVDQVIKNMDSNGDGAVSFDEYMKFMAFVFTGQLNQFQPAKPSATKKSSKKK